MQRLTKTYFTQQARFLSTAPPVFFEKRQEHLVLRAFRRAVDRSPAYRKLLKEYDVTPAAIRNISDFKKWVPVIDKGSLFNRFPTEDIFPGITRNSSGRIWTSSGTSSIFSTGYESPTAAPNSTVLDFMLDFFFDVIAKKTLFISCLTDAWPMSSRFFHHANVSTREDAAISLICRLDGIYDQFILGGEPLLLKRIVEYGISAGINFATTRVHCISGGDYAPSAYTRYMTSLLNPDMEDTRAPNKMLNNMGMAEFGLGVFFETPTTARIRAMAVESTCLQEAIAPNLAFVPQVFQANPLSTFVETISNASGERTLVLTNLNPKSELPLIRYNTGDIGRVFGFEAFNARVANCEMKTKPTFEFPFPFAVVVGKKRRINIEGGRSLDAATCAERIFSHQEIASRVTGNFALSPKSGKHRAALKIQLSEAFSDQGMPAEIGDRLNRQFNSERINISFIPFYAFPHHMGIRFDKKVAFIHPSEGPRPTTE